MKLFGLQISRASRALAPVARGGWFPVIRESSTGAWQQNLEITAPSALTNPTVFACVTLIASDIGKVSLRLVREDEAGIWTEASSPAFSPVLRKPNRAQTIVKFLESWMISKLLTGNTYVLKARDDRGVVTGLWVLDPARVTPLVTPEGGIYYQVGADALAGLEAGATDVVVPAREIIHDRFNCLFNPLVGISPLYASGGPAAQGLKIQDSAIRFFSNNARPSGILTAPGAIDNDQATRFKERWESAYSGDNYGRVAVLGAGLDYKPLSMSAVDSQQTEQDQRTSELICMAFHVPAALIDASHQPPYANFEPLLLQYYVLCLQPLMRSLETALDEGLELPARYGTEFDVDDLIWMDQASRTKAAHDAISAGALAPNEARAKYFGLGPVAGGDTPYLQQQYFSLAALAERDAAQPFAKPAPPPAPLPAEDEDDDEGEKAFDVALTKAVEDLHAA